jgi:hypothetical protein
MQIRTWVAYIPVVSDTTELTDQPFLHTLTSLIVMATDTDCHPVYHEHRTMTAEELPLTNQVFA